MGTGDWKLTEMIGGSSGKREGHRTQRKRWVARGGTQVWGKGIKVTEERQEMRVKGRHIGKDRTERRKESAGSARETYERTVGRQARR